MGGATWGEDAPANLDPRAPGGYLSPRGSESSPVGIPSTSSPPLLGEADGIWVGGVPPGPCGASSCKEPGAQRGESRGLTCFVLFSKLAQS